MVVLAASVAAPLILLSGASAWYAYASQRARQEAILLGRAQSVADMVDRRFEGVMSALRVLATSRALADGHLQGFDTMMRETSRELGGALVNLTAANGEVTLTTLWPKGFHKPGVQASRFLLNALHGNRTEISDLIVGPQSHRQEVGVAVPVSSAIAGKPAWMLSLYLAPDALTQELDSLHLPPGWLAAISDRHNRIVARSRLQDRFIGHLQTPELLAATEHANAGMVSGSHRALDGVPTLTAFARAPWSGYIATVGIPEAEFTAPLRATLVRTLGVAALLTAFGVGGALLLSRHIVGALRTVAEASPGTMPPSGLREIDELADAIAETDRRRRESEAALRDLVATIDLAAVFVREWDGRIQFWSRGCERLYGWTAAEAIDRSAHELLGIVFPVPFAEIEASLLKDGEWEGDVLHHHRNGTAMTMSVRKVLRQKGENESPVVMESVADVTALRAAEGKLRALNQHLEARVRAEVFTREAAQARAAQAERLHALGLLAGGIAHDFNNVLQAVLGCTALIAKRTDSDRVRELAEKVRDAANRGASVTRRLLVFARRGDLKTEAFEPAALLTGLKDILEPTMGDQIAVTLEIEPGLPAVLADRGQLETALVNLGVNARDAMPDGGTVTLRAWAEAVPGPSHKAGLPPGRYVAFAVADTGTGMAPDVLARVTEPFFTTKGPSRGTGLGLAVARGFAEQSKGALQVESAPGAGTTVTLWLPVAEGAAIVSPEANGLPITAPAGARVLLVDDDADVREGLAAGLSEAGYQVQVAESPERALALIRQGEGLECLVTDLSMPGMNGVALLQAARIDRPGLPAIVLTGYADHEALAGSDMAAYALLWKPAEPGRIASRIAELLSGEGGGAASDQESPAPEPSL